MLHQNQGGLLMQLDSRQIQQILPHRYPFLMIDKVTDCQPGKSADAVRCVSANELQFMGHFPSYPVMPGVLIIEAMAQTGAVALLTMPENAGRLVFFGGIRNARFRRQVVPGDVIEIHCELTKMRGSVGFGTAVATVDGERAAEAELSFVVGDVPAV